MDVSNGMQYACKLHLWHCLICRKCGKAQAQMQMGQSVTHAAIQPTHSPSWEELLLVEVKEEESKDEGLSSETE